MEKRQIQRSELLPGCATALASLVLCALFVFYLHGVFLHAVGQYDRWSREHARALFLRADAEELFVESTARILQSDVLVRSDASRLDSLAELPVITNSGVEGINDSGRGIILRGGGKSPKGTEYEFFRQAKILSNMGGVFAQEKYKDRRRLLISAEDALLFNSFDTAEDWKNGSRQSSIELGDYIEEVRAPIFHDDADLAGSAGVNKGSVWTAAHASVVDGTQVITCYVPIYDQHGRLASYLMGEVAISALEGREWLQQYGMSLALFDSKERLVVADAALEGTRALRTHQRAVQDSSGFNFEIDGTWLLIFVEAPQVHWRVVYGVPLTKVLLTHWLAIVFSSCVLVLGLAGTVWIARSIRRRMHTSAQQKATKVFEGRNLVQTVMDHSLVGLCLLRMSDGEVLIQNEQSRELITVDVEHDGRRWGLREYFLMMSDKEMPETGPLEIDAQTPDTGERMRVLAHLVKVNYYDEPALFCSFGDDNERRNAELILVSAKASADEANAAKSTFLAMMSHEIRTPLYGVLGTLELLANTTLLQQQRGYLNTIEHSSSNLLNIIDDILDFSRIEANQLTLESEPFNLVELAEGVARSFVSLAQKKGVELYCCLQPDLPLLAGDRNRLQQVLSNLLSNAVKFTDSGKIVI
ncbi:histidine kinase dimerization/phospho-acceptor domain-containing protein, partial [Pseudomonas fluorescens]